MKHFQLSPSLLLSLFLGAIVLPEIFVLPRPLPLVGAHPILLNASSSSSSQTSPVTDIPNNHYMQYNHEFLNNQNTDTGGSVNGDIECKMCSYVASKLNTTLFHNPKVIDFVTADIEKICNVLPESVQPACNNAAVNIAPVVLQQLGVFIADEGCEELGICPGH